MMINKIPALLLLPLLLVGCSHGFVRPQPLSLLVSISRSTTTTTTTALSSSTRRRQDADESSSSSSWSPSNSTDTMYSSSPFMFSSSVLEEDEDTTPQASSSSSSYSDWQDLALQWASRNSESVEGGGGRSFKSLMTDARIVHDLEDQFDDLAVLNANAASLSSSSSISSSIQLEETFVAATVVPNEQPTLQQQTTTTASDADAIANLLAREWAAINRDQEESSSVPSTFPPPRQLTTMQQKHPTTPAAATATAPVLPPPLPMQQQQQQSQVSYPSMQDLAQQWAIMNSDHNDHHDTIDSSHNTFLPTAPAKPSTPPLIPATKATTVAVASPPLSIPVVTNLASEWATLNKERNHEPHHPINMNNNIWASFPSITTAPKSDKIATATATTATTKKDVFFPPVDVASLAQEWASVNRDKQPQHQEIMPPPPSQVLSVPPTVKTSQVDLPTVSIPMSSSSSSSSNAASTMPAAAAAAVSFASTPTTTRKHNTVSSSSTTTKRPIITPTPPPGAGIITGTDSADAEIALIAKELKKIDEEIRAMQASTDSPFAQLYHTSTESVSPPPTPKAVAAVPPKPAVKPAAVKKEVKKPIFALKTKSSVSSTPQAKNAIPEWVRASPAVGTGSVSSWPSSPSTTSSSSSKTSNVHASSTTSNAIKNPVAASATTGAQGTTYVPEWVRASPAVATESSPPTASATTTEPKKKENVAVSANSESKAVDTPKYATTGSVPSWVSSGASFGPFSAVMDNRAPKTEATFGWTSPAQLWLVDTNISEENSAATTTATAAASPVDHVVKTPSPTIPLTNMAVLISSPTTDNSKDAVAALKAAVKANRVKKNSSAQKMEPEKAVSGTTTTDDDAEMASIVQEVQTLDEEIRMDNDVSTLVQELEKLDKRIRMAKQPAISPVTALEAISVGLVAKNTRIWASHQKRAKTFVSTGRVFRFVETKPHDATLAETVSCASAAKYSRTWASHQKRVKTFISTGRVFRFLENKPHDATLAETVSCATAAKYAHTWASHQKKAKTSDIATGRVSFREAHVDSTSTSPLDVVTERNKKVQETVENRVGSTTTSPLDGLTEWHKRAQEVVEDRVGSTSTSPTDHVGSTSTSPLDGLTERNKKAQEAVEDRVGSTTTSPLDGLTEWHKKAQEVVYHRVGSTSNSPTDSWYKKAQEVVEAAAAAAAAAGSRSISPWDIVKNVFAGTGSTGGQTKISSKKRKLATPLRPLEDNAKVEHEHRSLLIRHLGTEATALSSTASSPSTSVPSVTATDHDFNMDYSI